MKKKILILTIMIACVAMVVVFSGPATAAVTGACVNCHTMHNSQGGSDLYASESEHLLVGGCVACHSHATATTYALGTSTVPVVYNTSAPSTYLAGGNFHWVAQAGGDAKGHNVYGISAQDTNIDTTEGAPGSSSCNAGSCHSTLALETTAGYVAKGGCQGCHLKVRHHTSDGTGTKYVGVSPWYRFLTLGHSGSAPDGTTGVEGIEHSGWGPTTGTVGGTDHNEYKGLTGQGSGTAADGTMTFFCAGCHGDFHATQGSPSPWTRHPSDLTIPNTGEYASIATFGYSPVSPVARTDAAMTALAGAPSGSVAAASDMVMCLSCHRPHGSPYDDMLRWDYSGMVAGSGTGQNTGCFYCHSQKDAG